MKVHFIIVNKDVKEDYFAVATQINNSISFKNKGIETTFTIADDVLIERKGDMHYIQRFKLNERIKGMYEIMGMNINISAYTKKLRINDSGIYIEYDQYLDDSFESNIKIYLKF